MLSISSKETSAISPLPPFHIRTMEEKDISQVQAIDKLSFTVPWPERAYQFELKENQNSLLWVAELQATNAAPAIIGLIVVWMILDEAHIASIAVHPDYRGQGIAQHLMATALKDAFRHKAIQATLEVRSGNQAAIRLYRHFGFDVAGLRPRYYRDNNEDAIIITLFHLDETYIAWMEREGWKTTPATKGGEL